MDRGWAINIGKRLVATYILILDIPGGGFHHCSNEEGGGFCAYADITLAIKVQL